VTATPPEIQIKSARRSIWERTSLIWLIPIFAVLISVFLAWQNYASRGPIIEITFSDASGIRAGETELRYRDVTVGIVDKVGFSDDLSNVEVTVRLDKSVAPFADGDAQFWIVSPELTTRGITGLETVLSGVFIEASWDESPDGIQYFFEGSVKAPLIRPGQEGLLITLRTTEGEGLTSGTPILYKGIEVGRISNARIATDGISSAADAFIEAPYDRLINTSTRFWDTSGFTFSIGADGADIDFKSLATLIAGGITFDTIVSGGDVVETGTLFRLYAYESLARNSVFADADSDAELILSTVFESNASGLAVGAPVELGGITIGEITGITGFVDPDTFGDNSVRLLATFAVRANKLGLGDGTDSSAMLDFLETRVQEGLRARLVAASIFTGGLKVQLAQIENAVPDSIDRGGIPFPVFPSTSPDISDVTATAEGVFERLNNLPIEDVLDSVINLLDSGTLFLGSDSLNAVPDEVLGLVTDARGLIGAEEIQALPAQISATATALESAALDLQTILAQIEEQDGVTKILAAVETLNTTAQSFDTAAQGLPTLIEELTRFASNLEQLDFNTLFTGAIHVLDSADRLLSSGAMAELPENLNSTLDELRSAVQTFNTQDGMPKLIAAVEAAGNAAAQIETATVELPALIDNLTSLSERIRDLPVDGVIEEVTAFLDSAEKLIGTEDARQLPAEMNDAISELTAVLKELREGGTVENANAAMAAASGAATSIQQAADQLPTLVRRLNSVLALAEGTLAGLDEKSTLNYEARTALRDIQAAADAVASLARAIERRPNSLLTGR
jgi:paraquat-inducible protein B